MPEVELSAGVIEYTDTGAGPIVVLLHGLLMDNSVWRHVIADLAVDHRCVAPTLPLGSHRIPMRPDADLSLVGQARLVGEFLDRLDLTDVTLVGNDWGGAQWLAGESPDRIGRLVLTSCEAFDNFPPGLPGKLAALAGKLPGGIHLAIRALRIPALRRLPTTFGRMTKRPVPAEIWDRWLAPGSANRDVRRDLSKYCRTFHRDDLLRAAERFGSFDRPVLVAWAAEDRVMPREHGRRLADSFPNGKLVEIVDSCTVIPEDRPAELARLIRDFVREPVET